jgi:hypothetical protein
MRGRYLGEKGPVEIGDVVDGNDENVKPIAAEESPATCCLP